MRNLLARCLIASLMLISENARAEPINKFCYDRETAEQIDECLMDKKEYEKIVAEEKSRADISIWIKYGLPMIVGLIGGIYIDHNYLR
jgi:hypothetical protein